MKTTEFKINNTEGEWFFNEKYQKYQINIDMIDFILVDETHRFDTEKEMNNFLNNLTKNKKL